MKEKRYVYAIDDEYFNIDNENDAVEAAHEHGFNCYQRGVVREVSPKNLIDADDIRDILACRADDIAGEFAEFYPEFSDEAGKELENFLHNWIEKHCKPSFYFVDDVETFTIPIKNEEGN